MAIISKLIEGLENDVEHFVRVYPINPKGFAQSELDGQVASVIPVAGVALSTFAEGAVVMIEENGVAAPFYLSKHDYESGLNGAGRSLFVRKDVYEKAAWDSHQVNAYAESDIDAWFNNDYKALFNDKVQELMGVTKFNYTEGNGSETISTLERAVFALSPSELGITASYANTEGSALPIASTLQIASLNGSTSTQWTRAPRKDTTNYAYFLSASGSASYTYTSTAVGRRPAFTLPSSTLVNPVQNADGSYNLLV